MTQPKQRPQLNGIPISDVSIKQPVFITMVMLTIVVFGLLAYSRLPVNLLPDISVPVVVVSVPYPGAGPESVAEQVARPIEENLNTLNGIDGITSTSNEGITQIILEFETDVDIDQAEQDVREQVNAVLPQLPSDVQDPLFFTFDPNDAPIITLAVTDGGVNSSLELRRIIDDDIVPQLQRIQGVGSVDVDGGDVRQINVQMDLAKLQAWQVLPVQITQAIRQANTNLGLGSITEQDRDVSLRAPSLLQEPEDITLVQITNTPYRVGDLATIEDGVAEVDSYSRLNGEDAITIDIQKQSGSNTVTVAEDVKSELERIFAELPDLSYVIPLDQSEAVQESTESAIHELLLASVAAFIIVLLFFRNLRNTIVTLVGLPIIIIGTFAAISIFGLTINLITLLALSLCVGLVIDDAIVVRENIFRRLELGESPMIAASRGTAEVALPVLAMTLTIIAVFVPVAFTSGVAGVVFFSFGITVACAMAFSLFEAFTLAPMMSAYFTKRNQRRNQDQNQQEDNDSPSTEHIGSDTDLPDEANEKLGRVARFYGSLLNWSLKRRFNRLLIVFGAVVILIFSGVIASVGLRFSFFPAEDVGEFNMAFETEPGTPLEFTDELARQAEEIILADPAVDIVQTSVGGQGEAEQGQLFISLHEGELTPPVQERLREQLSFLPLLVLGQPDFAGSGTGVQSRDVVLSVQSTRPIEELIPILQELQGSAESIPGLVDIDTTYKPGRPELQFQADPTRIGDLGLTNDDIASSVRALIEGDQATVLRQDGEDTDVVVRLQPSDRAGVGDVQSITVPTSSGNVPLSTLGTIELASSPTTVRRADLLEEVLIGANVEGRNAAEVQAEIAAGIDALNLPSDVTVRFAGDAEALNEGFDTLFIAMGLSVLFVYMVLASQFGSFLQPFLIMLAMPFSFIGAFLALVITGIELDITGMIGLIMLLGLVVKNSILLVEFTNRLRESGMEKHAAIELAGAIRLRPILMTTLSLVAGAVPIAIGLGEGSEFRRGLSVVLIGGLLTSMFLTLLVVPVAYSLLDSTIQRILRLFRRAPQPALALSGAGIEAPQSVIVPGPQSNNNNMTDIETHKPTIVSETNGSNGNAAGHDTAANGSNGSSTSHDTPASGSNGEAIPPDASSRPADNQSS
ncbi:MAG: efflux RND transporter permease subunit [Chloroflexota bacterium]